MMRLPRFIGHPNGIVFCVFKQKRSKTSVLSPPSVSIEKRKMETKTDQRGKQQLDMSAVLEHTSSSITRCGTIPRVLKRKISTSSLASSSAAAATSIVKRKMETKTDQRGKQQFNMLAVLVTNQYQSTLSLLKDLEETETKKRIAGAKRLPSFISHPNGMIPRVFKKQRSRISSLSSEPTFICHPSEIVLKVLNQKLRPQKQST